MFKPLNNRVLIKPDEAEEKTESGIYIARKKEEKPSTGVIIVGNDTVNKGDKVVFSRFGFDEVKINKEIYYVVSDLNLLGIFE